MLILPLLKICHTSLATVLFVFMPLFDSCESIGWTNLGFATFNVLTIKLNLSLLFSCFCGTRWTKSIKKCRIFLSMIPVLKRLLLLCFSLNLFPAWCWLVKSWQLGQQEAVGSIRGGIQICETSLQALIPFPPPSPSPNKHPKPEPKSLLAG